MQRVALVALSLVLLMSGFNLACDNDTETTPPDPTDNNTVDSAWNVTLPYTLSVSVPDTDPGEWFHFGPGSSEAFGAVILVKLNLVEPTSTSFYLKAELLTDDQALLVSSRESELVSTTWIATRSGQIYYLHIIPTGSPAGGRYTYSMEISSSALNDPFEPDDSIALANPLELGQQHEGSYLADAYSDTLVPMQSIPDFYSFEISGETTIQVIVSGLGGDCEPLLRLYNPDAELFGEAEDTSALFDLEGEKFKTGVWCLELTDKDGEYPTYGAGEVPYNYVDTYTLIIVEK